MMQYKGLIIGTGNEELDGCWVEGDGKTLVLASYEQIVDFMKPEDDEPVLINELRLKLTTFKMMCGEYEINLWIPEEWDRSQLNNKVLEWFLLRELQE